MHFLRKDELYAPQWVGRPWACVTVKLIERGVLEVQENSIGIVRADAEVVRLPDRILVRGPEGKRVKPSKKRNFYVSVGTFDPFHFLIEAESVPLPSKQQEKSDGV
jgi:hypothetical protein